MKFSDIFCNRHKQIAIFINTWSFISDGLFPQILYKRDFFRIPYLVNLLTKIKNYLLPVYYSGNFFRFFEDFFIQFIGDFFFQLFDFFLLNFFDLFFQFHDYFFFFFNFTIFFLFQSYDFLFFFNFSVIFSEKRKINR